MKMSRTFCSVAAALCIVSSPAHAWDAARGQEIAAVCGVCHGPDGNSPSADFPTIAGQYKEYLFRAMLDYKLGNRQDPVMVGQVAELSRRDMRDLAAYFASREGLHLQR